MQSVTIKRITEESGIETFWFVADGWVYRIVTPDKTDVDMLEEIGEGEFGTIPFCEDPVLRVECVLGDFFAETLNVVVHEATNAVFEALKDRGIRLNRSDFDTDKAESQLQELLHGASTTYDFDVVRVRTTDAEKDHLSTAIGKAITEELDRHVVDEDFGLKIQNAVDAAFWEPVEVRPELPLVEVSGKKDLVIEILEELQGGDCEDDWPVTQLDDTLAFVPLDVDSAVLFHCAGLPARSLLDEHSIVDPTWRRNVDTVDALPN